MKIWSAIVEILREATEHWSRVSKGKSAKYPARYRIDVHASQTSFQAFHTFPQGSANTRGRNARKPSSSQDALRERRMRNVSFECHSPTNQPSLSSNFARQNSRYCRTECRCLESGCTFDAWDYRFPPENGMRVGKTKITWSEARHSPLS